MQAQVHIFKNRDKGSNIVALFNIPMELFLYALSARVRTFNIAVNLRYK
jgi:hypothetical protein